MLKQIHKFIKEKPLQTFLIIVVIILITYYFYDEYFKKEHLHNGTSIMSHVVSYSSLCIICMIIPYIILYYMVKYASKNAIREMSSQSNQSKS